MLNTIIEDYLWTVDTDNDLELFDVCLQCEEIIKKQYAAVPVGTYGSATTALFRHYNIFTFANPSIVKLYHKIAQGIRPFLDPAEQYVCQAWLNVFRTGECIDWHQHWDAEDRAFHGYYCVNAGNSVTSYMLNGQIYHVNNRDGLLVFGHSAGDQHRSSEWNGSLPRITIAFDVVPASYMDIAKREFDINHFIPI